MAAEFSRTPENPFRSSTDPRLLYFDTRRRQAIARLISGLYQGEGLFLLTGRPGIGKTVLLRHLADQLQALDGIVLLSPHLIACHAGTGIAQIFQSFEAHLPHAAIRTDSLQLVRALQEITGGDHSAVLLLDDAHLLAEDVLKTIIALTTLPTERRRLSVVAAGPPGLSAKIAGLTGDSRKPPSDRVIELEAMSEADAERMIRRRLHLAGGPGRIVDDEAVTMAARKGEGVPLAVLRLCRGALQVGAGGGAATFAGSVVDPPAPAAAAVLADRPQPTPDKTAKTAGPTEDADSPGRFRFGADAAQSIMPGQWQPRSRRRRPGKFTFALAGLVLLVIGAGWTLSDRRDTAPATSGREVPATDQAAAGHTWWQPAGSTGQTGGGQPSTGIAAERSIPPDVANLQPSAGGDGGTYPPPSPALTSSPDTAQKLSPPKPRPRPGMSNGEVPEGNLPGAGEAKKSARKLEIETSLAEGDARLAEGDPELARAAYEHAFDKGSADGAMRIAEMFDPRNPAARLGIASPAESILWYKDAARRGNKQAYAALEGLASWLEEAASKGDRQARRVLDVWRAADSEPASVPPRR